MRRILLLIFWQFGLLAGGGLFADVVTLKDGHQISGLVETGNIQQLHIKVGDQSQTIDVHEVQAIQLGISLPAPPAGPPPAKAADPAPTAAPPPAKAANPAPPAAPPPAKAADPAPPTAPPPAKAANLVPEPAPAAAGAATRRAAAMVAGAMALLGVVALVFCGGRFKKGLTNAPQTPFTDGLMQPAFIDSKRGRQ